MDKNGEIAFLSKMADEVRRKPDPQMKKLLDFCDGKASVLEQCLGNLSDQKKHAAVMASTLFLDLNFMMNSHEVLADRQDLSVWTEEDRFRVMYCYSLDLKAGQIRIQPKAMWAGTTTVNENVEFEPMLVNFPVPDLEDNHYNQDPQPEPSRIIVP